MLDTWDDGADANLAELLFGQMDSINDHFWIEM
jgi:hypothetical protein